MAKKRHTAEQIISKLREAEVLLAKDTQMPQVCRKLGVTEQSYYRCRKEYGRVRTVQVKRLKELEKENARLKKVMTSLASGLWGSFRMAGAGSPRLVTGGCTRSRGPRCSRRP